VIIAICCDALSLTAPVSVHYGTMLIWVRREMGRPPEQLEY